MRIDLVRLTNFRNFESLVMEPGPGINYLYGDNGQGKTNLLEAIFYCSTLRSHRTSRDAEMIKKGCGFFRVDAHFNRNGIDSEIQIIKNPMAKKMVNLDNLPVRRSADVVGKVNTVLFSPEDLRIVKGSPGDRRKFFDFLMCQVSPKYYSDLQEYSKLLLSRNRVLKDVKWKPSYMDVLDDIDGQLSTYGAAIMIKRRDMSGRIDGIFREKAGDISGEREKMSFVYLPDLACDKDSTEADIREKLFETLRKGRREDIRREQTQAGIHRDDWDVIFDAGSVKAFGSQGQQRTAALSLKLAEISIFEEVNGEPPVILLDDVMSELDEKRRAAISGVIAGNQTFFTGTDRGFFDGNSEGVRYYFVQKGRMRDELCSCT